ncbi:hypothetical protein [Butyricicoccus sp.]|uniref:zinc ribbon domain-containing protein n=1 Tax=Butyricicoccus sp. TaxID=2049021 RepID=UPI003F16577D
MYCNQCGCQLPADAKYCQNCHAPAEAAAYCGGFWGLVGQKQAPAATRKPSASKPPVVALAACAVLLLLLAAQTVRVHMLSTDLAQSNATISSYTEAATAAQALRDTLPADTSEEENKKASQKASADIASPDAMKQNLRLVQAYLDSLQEDPEAPADEEIPDSVEPAEPEE